MGPGSIPGWGTGSHMLTTKIPHATVKIPSVSANSRCSRIFKKKKKTHKPNRLNKKDPNFVFKCLWSGMSKIWWPAEWKKEELGEVGSGVLVWEPKQYSMWTSANWGKSDVYLGLGGNPRAHQTALLLPLSMHSGFPLTSPVFPFNCLVGCYWPTYGVGLFFFFFCYCIFQYSFKNLPEFTSVVSYSLRVFSSLSFISLKKWNSLQSVSDHPSPWHICGFLPNTYFLLVLKDGGDSFSTWSSLYFVHGNFLKLYMTEL